MKAWLVQFYWYQDPSVISHIAYFGETEDEVRRAAQSHCKEHGINCIERAPWLDKPE